jgi:hypothetical protein
MVTRAINRPLVESEIQELLRHTPRSAERRSPPADASGQDQRRTRQRRSNSAVTNGGHVADARIMQGHATPVGPVPVPSSQFTGNQGDSGEAGWPTVLPIPNSFVSSEPFHTQLPARATWEAPRYSSSQRGELGTAPDVTSSARSRGVNAQDPVIANGSSIPPPTMANVLRTSWNQRQAGMSRAAQAPASTSPTQLSAVSVANSSSAEADLSPLRPSRNRPW